MGNAISLKMRNLALILVGLYRVYGHGAMYYPNPWQTTKGCSIDGGCEFEMTVPWNGCEKVGKNGCSKSASLTAFFTNYTQVEEETLPEDMYSGGTNTWEGLEGFNPWSSPGAAPTWGDGCGANGGNPYGCLGEDDVFGRCCGGKDGCGGYVGGKSALEHYKEGFFGNPTTTTWVRGEPAEVGWTSKTAHRGGYAYRLCKVKKGKVWKVTEKCFQKGHLNFYGNKTWLLYKPNGLAMEDEEWEAVDLVTTREGTTPKGSEWASMNILPRRKSGDRWAIKDLVEVPESLEPGEYVLSFRWDCQKTPQVWNSCANIQVV